LLRSDFIRDIVAEARRGKEIPANPHALSAGAERLPPHRPRQSICLNFGIAREFGGVCNLRMDDTNPTKEDVEYVDSIQEDVNWLIAGWADDKLGLKPKGATPETIAEEGKRDFYLPAVTKSAIRNPQSETLEPFYASIISTRFTITPSS
jgi:glutaminyl-tRNA synthetase